jgi:hypothetical protein
MKVAFNLGFGNLDHGFRRGGPKLRLTRLNRPGWGRFQVWSTLRDCGGGALFWRE